MGVSTFKKDYQPRTNTVENEKTCLFAEPHSILARWRNRFSQLINVHGVNDVRQTEKHKAEPPMPAPSSFDVDMATE